MYITEEILILSTIFLLFNSEWIHEINMNNSNTILFRCVESIK